MNRDTSVGTRATQMKEGNEFNDTGTSGVCTKKKQILVVGLVQISLTIRIRLQKTYFDITRLSLILHPTKFIVIVTLDKLVSPSPLP